MGKPSGIRVAENAAAKAIEGTITYQQQDCQDFIEHCVIDCGGAMSYAGSNDMFRRACEWVKKLNGVPADLEPGMLVFKHRLDGGEPEKYKADGIGNAYHVGLYCDTVGVEVAHSTTTKTSNGAQAAKLSAGWTHYGPAKCIEYDGAGQEQEGGGQMEAGQKATVSVKSGTTANLRAGPGTDTAYLGKVTVGTTVDVLETAQNSKGESWAKISVGGTRTGYMMADFLRFDGETAPVAPDGEYDAQKEIAAIWAEIEAIKACVYGQEGAYG